MAVVVPALGVWLGVGAYVMTIAGAILGGTGGAGLLGRHLDSERQMSILPTLMHFNHANFTDADMKVLNGMTIYPQDGDRAIFYNEDFVSVRNLTKVC